MATIDPSALSATYGADANGLICGFRFRSDASIAPIDSSAGATEAVRL